jgi:hypothetical protein
VSDPEGMMTACIVTIAEKPKKLNTLHSWRDIPQFLLHILKTMQSPSKHIFVTYHTHNYSQMMSKE